MGNAIDYISDIGLVPLIVLENEDDAAPLGKALVSGGIPIAEVTLRTPAALKVIETMSRQVPEILVGAGTVHNVEQAKSAVEAGAKFIVTPGLNPKVTAWCKEHEIDVIPGTVTPSDLEHALDMGITTCKFFPAEAYGGVKTLKALAGPYKDIRFMPTGGINENNMLDYLALENVMAVGGSFMAPDKLVKEKQWDQIASLCRQSINKMLGFSLLHVGINTKDSEDALSTAEQLSSLFSLPVTEYPGAYFAGSMVEVIKGKFLGTNGHIAVLTNDIDRAVSYFTRRRIAFDMETANRDGNGKLVTIYFKDEIGGFAIHLRRK
jgi:2-dehydro-3-deoxyphosphogluconate aldolase/(4S)-4-hydroxy-2-oxoglutarate aldolase